MVIDDYNLNFENTKAVEIAVRLSYWQTKILIELVKSIPSIEAGEQLKGEISNLESALLICTGEFISGARNIH